MDSPYPRGQPNSAAASRRRNRFSRVAGLAFAAHTSRSVMANDPVERLLGGPDTLLSPRADFADALPDRLLGELDVVHGHAVARAQEETMTGIATMPSLPRALVVPP